MTCVRSSGSRRSVVANPARSSSTGAHCSRPARVDLAPVTTATNANAAARFTWQLILWGNPTKRSARRSENWPRQVQQATGQTVKVTFADEGYTGEDPAQAARDEGTELQVIKLSEAKKGFVLLPRRWVVERSFGWLNRFRRLARDYERLPETLAGLQFVVFSVLMLVHFASLNKST
jgi:transposase